ncbi:MAG: threonyl-tRNA synthetase editing domain-containing protein [Bacteroidales bacterium]|nr:threonyl-tRNA synthetase editing domain-containing protein [Bacteroidales bacterium]
MKLLMMYTQNFSYFPRLKNLDEAKEINEGQNFQDALVAFIHAEEADEEDFKKTETKLVKNLKWAAKKNNTNRVILHSFAHLSDSKASPEFTQELFDKTEAKMKNADYEAFQTPFGYFLDISLDAPGYSLARIFKSF